MGEPTGVRRAPGSSHDASASDVVIAAYDAHQRELYTFLLGMTRDPDTANDLLQETFARYMASLAEHPAPTNERAWLYRVAGNLALSRGRRIGARQRWEARQRAGQPVGSPEEEVVRTERERELLEAMAVLSADARGALLMSAQGFSGVEIAATLGRTEQATRTMLSRARMRIRSRLIDDRSGS